MRSVQCRRTFARCEDGAPPAVRLTRHHHPVELEATHEEPVPAVAVQLGDSPVVSVGRGRRRVGHVRQREAPVSYSTNHRALAGIGISHAGRRVSARHPPPIHRPGALVKRSVRF